LLRAISSSVAVRAGVRGSMPGLERDGAACGSVEGSDFVNARSSTAICVRSMVEGSAPGGLMDCDGAAESSEARGSACPARNSEACGSLDGVIVAAG